MHVCVCRLLQGVVAENQEPATTGGSTTGGDETRSRRICLGKREVGRRCD